MGCHASIFEQTMTFLGLVEGTLLDEVSLVNKVYYV